MLNGWITKLKELEADLKECRAVLKDVAFNLSTPVTESHREVLVRYINRVLDKTEGGAG